LSYSASPRKLFLSGGFGDIILFSIIIDKNCIYCVHVFKYIYIVELLTQANEHIYFCIYFFVLRTLSL
jgi:hypothetical protein